MENVAPDRSPPVASGSDPPTAEIPISYPKARLFGTIILWGILGGLIVKLGGSDFGRYVRMFYASNSDGFRWLSKISELAHTLRPVAWFVPVIVAVIACWRLKRPFWIVLFVGLFGAYWGYSNASYRMANPGPNYYTGNYTIPLGCFVGTLVGAVIQVVHWSIASHRREREDW
jgi:hypothetical protein